MNNQTAFEFDSNEREILLRGLQFVRSSVQLNVYDPTEENERSRADQIREVDELIERLSGTAHKTAAGV